MAISASTICTLRRVVFMLLVVSIDWIPVHAQFASPSVDGVIQAGEYGNTTNGTNVIATATNQTWYMTWDATNLYFGITNANLSEGAIIYIDASPIIPANGGTNANGTLVGMNYDNTEFSSLPFRTQFVTYFKDGYDEYRKTDGSGGWGAATSNFGTYASNINGLVREFAIPWTAISGGIPASFLFFGYLTSSAGYVYGQVPNDDPGAFIGISASYTQYFAVNSTSNGASTAPFSVEQSSNTPPGSTPVGNNVPIIPVDATSGKTPVSLTFSTVTQVGSTSLTIGSSGPPPPTGFKLGQPPTYYDLSTTATYSGSIAICINYAGVSFSNLNNVAIWHYDTSLGSWTKLTTTINTGTTTACASTPSLSPFTLFEIAYAAQVEQPINPDGSSVFSATRGVVPIKFTLALNGVATCTLPAATIAVTRTVGGTTGSIDESTYSMSADSSANFRIDSANCQYIYNLASSVLGPGLYQVNIIINGYLVGSGVFALK